MSPALVIASNTYRQTVRQRLFYNVILFGLGMVLFSMVVGNLTFGFPDRVVRSIGLSAVSMAIDLIALLTGVGLIYEEIDRKTLFVVLARPVRRWQYVLGRYLGLLLALLVSFGGLTLVFIATLITVRGSPTLNDVIALSASLPEAAILAGFGLVLSSFSTPTLSAGIGFGLWIASASTDDLVQLTKNDPVGHTLAQGVYYVLPALERFNFRQAAVHNLVVSLSDYAAAWAYGLVYVVVLVALGGAILSRREMI